MLRTKGLTLLNNVSKKGPIQRETAAAPLFTW